MAENSNISWTQDTWNPIGGCDYESPGCTNCYAAKVVWRTERMGALKYAGLTRLVNGRPVWTGEMRVADEKTLTWPLRKTRPRLIFVNSLSDLWHPGLPREAQFRIVDIMAAAPWHRFQVLTKRAGNLVDGLADYCAARGLERLPDHIWWGVSAEDQKRAAERIPLLARVPAKTRFVSMEPLLGPVDLSGLPPVEWYIVGGESVERGENRDDARAFDPDWARTVLAHTRAVGAAFHFKQLGSNPTTGRTASWKGGEDADIPDDLKIREYPDVLPMAA